MSKPIRPRDLEADTGSGPDQRSWMRALEAAGQLKRITEKVDWDEEIGAIARINQGLSGPALLFENIKDYQDGRCTKFLTCGLANKAQVALMLGLPQDSPDRALVRRFKDIFRNPIPPVTVATGPVKENILPRKQVNLWEFPAVKWHATDGGRYIDTFCGVITNDPVTDRPNVGLYRGHILGKRKIGKLLIPTQGWGSHFLKHKEAKKPEPLPVAIAHGWHDALPFCAGSPFPKHVCEWDMIGAILGRPVELVDCETVPLQVPASAEIVVEGYIDPDPATFEVEGPFADYPGYIENRATPKPVLRVTCVTHRNDPVLRGTIEGARPGFPTEDSMLCAYGWSAIAWNMLEDAGVSGVTDIWMTPVTTGANVVVQIRKQYRGQAHQIASVLWGTSAANWFFKNVTVVEEDVDIRDPEALDWALAFRVNGARGDVTLFGPTFGSVLDPSTFPEERDGVKYGSGKWTRMLIDATRSWEGEPRERYGGRRYPPLNTIDPKLEKKIRKRWKSYGIGIGYMDADKRELLTFKKLSKRFKEV